MACGTCGAKKRNTVRVSSTYVPKQTVNNTELLMSMKVEKEKNVRGQNTSNTQFVRCND